MASKPGRFLTAALQRFLTAIRDGEDKYAISEGLAVWVDNARFSRATLTLALRLCLIRRDSTCDDKTEIWWLNEDGEHILRDPNFVPPIVPILAKELKHGK